MNDRNEQSLYRMTLDLHARGSIDEAITVAKQALEHTPASVELLQYLGSTYVARKKQFSTGLAYLELALQIAPDDPNLLYTAGWCFEFAAHETERRRGTWDKDGATPPASLYQRAAHLLRQSIAVQSDQGLRDDAAKLLETITGEEEI